MGRRGPGVLRRARSARLCGLTAAGEIDQCATARLRRVMQRPRHQKQTPVEFVAASGTTPHLSFTDLIQSQRPDRDTNGFVPTVFSDYPIHGGYLAAQTECVGQERVSNILSRDDRGIGGTICASGVPTIDARMRMPSAAGNSISAGTRYCCRSTSPSRCSGTTVKE